MQGKRSNNHDIDVVLANLPGIEDPKVREEVRKRVVKTLWERGNLRYLLDATQKKIVAALESSKSRKFYFLCSRRLGKSFTLVTLAVEKCLQKPNARVLYAAPYAKDAKEIVSDIMVEVLKDCPPELRPDYKQQDREYHFPNGSIIRFKAVNGEQAQHLRGGAADYVFLDECGIMDDLRYVVTSVVMPMLLTTGGRLILATTPPKSPGHDSAVIYEECAAQGASVTFTIHDNARVSDEIKAEFLIESGERPDDALDVLYGRKPPRSTDTQREYFCEFVTDANTAVLPEFDGQARIEMVRESPRPEFFDTYVAIDPGMKDRTGILYAYWDFIRGKLVIEDESLLQSPSTLTIAETLLEKEFELWRNQDPYLRISDVDLRLSADLWELHRIKVAQADKQDSLGAINRVRNMIQTRAVEIHPRCEHLIRQMKNATWNNKGSDFSRDAEKGPDGHYDLVAALKYLCRHVNYKKNPYPPGWTHVTSPDAFRSPRQNAFQRGQKLGILANTPTGRRLAGLTKTRR